MPFHCRFILVLLVFAMPSASRGAGLQTVEQGTFDLGRASVGLGTAADSAAMAFFNPAAMSLFEEPEITMGGMVISAESRFDANSRTTNTGGTGGNQTGNFVTPTGPFAVYPVNDDWAIGFSLTMPFAGSLDPDDGWAGRYMLQKIDLSILRIGPAVSYRVNDWLSVGASVGFNYVNLASFRAAIPTPGPDGRLRISDADDWETTWSVSTLLEPTDSTRIGVTYFSELDADDLSGDITVSGAVLPGFASGLDVKLTFPQGLYTGIRQEVTDDLTVFVDFVWLDFSEFDTIGIDTGGALAVNIPLHFRDTIAYGVGIDYELNPEWTVSAGISYASSPVSQSDRSAFLPLDRQIRYGTGVRYAVAEDLTVGLSYEYLDLGSSKLTSDIGAGTTSGKYDDSKVEFVALTVSKSF